MVKLTHIKKNKPKWDITKILEDAIASETLPAWTARAREETAPKNYICRK